MRRRKRTLAAVGCAGIGVGLTASMAVALADLGPAPSALSGGATTVKAADRNAFSKPLANLSASRREAFFVGNAFFRNPWVAAPASTTARDGLGPLFNTNTCQSCHLKDGRGRPPLAADEPFTSALVRLSIPAATPQQVALAEQLGVVPEPAYGDQLQGRAVPGVAPEGNASIDWQEQPGEYADGTRYSLRKPVLSIDQLAYGEMHPNTQFSIRTAPKMAGLGLLDTIPESEIVARADPDDRNNDGISGRPNRVSDARTGGLSLGRFGWKAGAPTVEQQSAGAFAGDIGISSNLFQGQPCTDAQADCTRLAFADDGPEISDEFLGFVVYYAKTLAVPARRDVDDPQVAQGEVLFRDAGCAACHAETIVTGEDAAFPELSSQVIHPYTDLLLHDMGEGLADGRPEFRASGSEWRTAPLWGVGLIETVNGHNLLLHDGRARGLAEAILWHGGEAEASKQTFRQMPLTDREALLAFLRSL